MTTTANAVIEDKWGTRDACQQGVDALSTGDSAKLIAAYAAVREARAAADAKAWDKIADALVADIEVALLAQAASREK